MLELCYFSKPVQAIDKASGEIVPAFAAVWANWKRVGLLVYHPTKGLIAPKSDYDYYTPKGKGYVTVWQGDLPNYIEEV